MINNNHLTRRNSLQVCSFMNTITHTTDKQSKILYRSTATRLLCIPRQFQKENTHIYITGSSLSLLTLARLKVVVDFNYIKHCNGLGTYLLRISLNISQSGTEKYCSKVKDLNNMHNVWKHLSSYNTDQFPGFLHKGTNKN